KWIIRMSVELAQSEVQNVPAVIRRFAAVCTNANRIQPGRRSKSRPKLQESTRQRQGVRSSASSDATGCTVSKTPLRGFERYQGAVERSDRLCRLQDRLHPWFSGNRLA